MEDLITAAEAAKIAGVSEKTLSRFAEAGYLEPKLERDIIQYAKIEVCKLFGIKYVANKIIHAPSENIDLKIEIEKVEKTNEQVPLTDIKEHPGVEQQESARLKHIIELQEQILAMKDREIEDLRNQREWYKERIEKLELKAERDQLLLISETQMITRMISQNKPKSPIKLALEWLGVGEVSSKNKEDIEVKINSDETR